MGVQLYFAYGSNLNVGGMASRCPDSEPVGPATLVDWMLTFRGVADIEPRAGARTHGVLWRLSDCDLDRLDSYEGYPGLYRRELVEVRTDAGKAIAIAYVMNDDYAGLPSGSYYRTIKEGYEHWDLPVLALERAVAMVKNTLFDRGITKFTPDGRKRLRPANP